MTMKDKGPRPKYVTGQKVIIQPIVGSGTSERENELTKFAGQVGEVTDYYWLNPRNGQFFYIYNVTVGENRKEIVVYEDELEPCLS